MYSFLFLLIVGIGSAAIIPFFGQVEQDINVQQSVIIICPGVDCEESITGFSEDILLSDVYTLKNRADSSRLGLFLLLNSNTERLIYSINM